MNHDFIRLAVVAATVTIDNALLAGILIPRTGRLMRFHILCFVAVLIAVSQIGMSIGIENLLQHVHFRVAAVVVLIGMSIRTIWALDGNRTTVRFWKVVALTYTYTAIGNMDNVLWLGSVLGGHLFWLAVASLVMIPLFVVVAMFLAEQRDKYGWIGILGAGMMAWVAGSLILLPPTNQWVARMPSEVFRVAFTALILVFGLWLRSRRQSAR